MTREVFTEIAMRLDTTDVYATGDFQCDASHGYPVTLNWNEEEGVAWIYPSVMLDNDSFNTALDLCADVGLLQCETSNQFNQILYDLDTDAYQFWAIL